MGLLANSPYLKGTVSTLGPMVMNSLEKAASRLGTTAADAAALRWFGDNSAPFKRTLASDLRRMRSVINVNTITIGQEDARLRNSGTNASAWTANGKVGLGGSVYSAGGNKGSHGFDARNVFIDGNFRSLPRFLPMTGGTVDASAWHQSQLNTLIHELTHLLIGTADEVGNSGDAYGTQRAAALAISNSVKAKNNAENWGIFIEACGYHLTS